MGRSCPRRSATGAVEPLLISSEEFRGFLARHAHLAAEGFRPVPEDNEAMTDAHVMIDPAGCFFGNADGRDQQSPPILEVGVEAALRSVGYRFDKLVARGGVYAW